VLLKNGWNMAKHFIERANQRKHQQEPSYKHESIQHQPKQIIRVLFPSGDVKQVIKHIYLKYGEVRFPRNVNKSL